jgi:hypothetical protein
MEGPRVIGRLLDAPSEPKVGTSVRLRFERYSDLKVPAFVLRSRPETSTARVEASSIA